jgi:hypothetical protein
MKRDERIERNDPMTNNTFHVDQENVERIIQLGTDRNKARFLADFALNVPCFPDADYGKTMIWEYISTDEDGAHAYYASLTDEEALSEAALALDAGNWASHLIDYITAR